jgi:hypothetical protein
MSLLEHGLPSSFFTRWRAVAICWLETSSPCKRGKCALINVSVMPVPPDGLVTRSATGVSS